jgi:hypothetical protein
MVLHLIYFQDITDHEYKSHDGSKIQNEEKRK